jgi:hypothetical protein
MYDIELLDIRLRKTPTGRKIVEEVSRHVGEIGFLINHHRPTMVTWQRNKGPEFISSVLKSGFDESSPIDKEIEGVTLSALVRRMAATLQEIGSPELKRAITQYLSLVLRMIQDCNSLQDVFRKVEEMDHLATENQMAQ